MKKVFIIITAIISIISCANLDEVWNELRDHEARIQKLEALCNKLNSNVEAIQTILTALEQNDYVTDIVKVMENGVEVGYSITFAKGGTVTVYHGADGAAPKVSIRKASDGVYYWTADDEWMTDDEGNMIPAAVPDSSDFPDAGYITPQFRVADGKWYVSVDNGNTWRQIESVGDQEKSIFSDIRINEDHIIFTLENGSTFTVPIYTASQGGVEDIYATSYGVVPGVVDMSKMENLLAAAKGKTIRFNDGEYIFPAHIKVPSDISFIGNTTTVFKLDDDSKSNVLFHIVSANNVTISRIFIDGGENKVQPMGSKENIFDRTDAGTRYGIWCEKSRRIKIHDVEIYGWDMCGLYCRNNDAAADPNGRFYHAIELTNSSLYCNYYGLWFGQYGEYNRTEGCNFGDNFIGVLNEGGNNMYVSCYFNSNYCGFALNGDGIINESHGGCYSCTYNHNAESGLGGGIAIYANKSTIGWNFIGENIWYGAIKLIDCKGIIFDGGVWGNVQFTSTSSEGLKNQNVVTDTYFHTNPDTIFRNNDGSTYVYNCMPDHLPVEPSEVDLFVFAGQSNMMGAAHLGPTEEVITESAYEYKYAPILRGEAKGKFVYAQHPAGEWHYMDPAKAYGPAYLDEATGKSKLTNFWDHTYFAPATRSLEKEIRSQSEYDHKASPSLPPYFAKYYTEMGNGCIYAHMAKGACQIIHYFTPDAVTEYNRLIADYNAANSTSYSGLSSSSLTGGGNAFDAKYFAMLRDYAEFRPGVTIKNKCFVWLQGESDEHNYIQYKLKLQALWSHLQSVGFTHFFILRVGYWGAYSIINEIKAQEDFCAENENCYIITRAPSLIPYPGATTSNWWKYEPSYEYNDCRDSYITNTTNKHFNEKAFKIFARKSADNIHRILHLGLEPLLEEENVKDMLPDDDNNEEPVEGEKLTPVIISGAYISSQQVYTVDAASCVHVFKVVPGTRYYLSAEKGPTGVDSNRNLIYAPIKDIKDVVPGAAVQFASGYTERIVIYAKDDVNGASDVFTVPSDCNYIAVSSYKSGAIINVIGQRADYYYGGVELYTVVEGAYLGNVVPTKFTASSTAYSQIFAVEPNTTYKATAVNPDKQIVYVLLESDTGLTIGGSLDFVSSNTTGARTVGEKNEPQVITTTADCHFIAFSGFKGTDGKYQHVKLEKVE